MGNRKICERRITETTSLKSGKLIFRVSRGWRGMLQKGRKCEQGWRGRGKEAMGLMGALATGWPKSSIYANVFTFARIRDSFVNVDLKFVYINLSRHTYVL